MSSTGTGGGAHASIRVDFGFGPDPAENVGMANRGPEYDAVQFRERSPASSDRAESRQSAQLGPPTDAEFAGLLADLGAQPPAESATDFDLKDVTIAALREVLEGLRPLGEQLAQSEQRHIELKATIEAAVDTARSACHAEHELEVERLKKSVEQLRGWLKKAHEKTAERQQVATERWREIQKLRGERTRLERELEKQSRAKKSSSSTS